MIIKLDLIRDLPRDKVMARKPTLVGIVLGVRFYECAIHGDDAPLIAMTDQQCGYSDFHDVPKDHELANMVSA